MKAQLAFICIFCTFLLLESRTMNQTHASPPVASDQHTYLCLADPCVLRYNRYYYIYGTDDRNPDAGIPVYRSKDLLHWEGPLGKRNGLALSKGDSFGDRGFWAPFVLARNNKLYMFYTANEQIAVAVSDSPLGPFEQQEKHPFPSDLKEIDPHVVVDDSGKIYMYFVRFEHGNRIFVEELNSDLLSRKPETRKECVRATEPWENASIGSKAVTEAPCTITHQGYTYLMYTCNDFRNPEYSVGYATSKSPFGPWTKYAQNPILRSDDESQGTGSCELIEGPGGNLFMFYHVHNSRTDWRPRRVMFSKCRFQPQGRNAPPALVVESERHSAMVVSPVHP